MHWSRARAWQSVNFGFSARRALIDHIQQIQPWPKQSAPPHHEILPLTAIKGPLPPTSPALNTSINYYKRMQGFRTLKASTKVYNLKLLLALIVVGNLIVGNGRGGQMEAVMGWDSLWVHTCRRTIVQLLSSVLWFLLSTSLKVSFCLFCLFCLKFSFYLGSD